MSASLNFVSDRLGSRQVPMTEPLIADVVGDVLGVLRLGRATASRTAHRAPWNLSFGAQSGAGFHVVLSGSCVLEMPDQQPTTLGPGDLVLLPQGLAHGLKHGVSGMTSMLCGGYSLTGGHTHPVLGRLPEFLVLPTAAMQEASLRAVIDVLANELEGGQAGAPAVVPSLVEVLLSFVLRRWYQEDRWRAGDPGGMAPVEDDVVAAALCDIHSNPAHPWTVADLGARGRLSRAAFARRFTMQVGEPPIAYVTRCRMSVAAQRLLRSNDSLVVVSREVGYLSEFAFAKAFKRQYGLAPGTFRRVRGASHASGA
jgi:AraC-like DNA-binding protein